jgi:hypothetical protein
MSSDHQAAYLTEHKAEAIESGPRAGGAQGERVSSGPAARHCPHMAAFRPPWLPDPEARRFPFPPFAHSGFLLGAIRFGIFMHREANKTEQGGICLGMHDMFGFLAFTQDCHDSGWRD